MGTSFGYNGRHQAISQKLKNLVRIVQNGIPYRLTILYYVYQLF